MSRKRPLGRTAWLGAVCAGIVALPLLTAQAVTILSGILLTVGTNDAVTIDRGGSPTFFGNVGTAGSYGFQNGWGVQSGTITWRDTNGATAATLSASGVSVPVTNRIANSNGSIVGSVTLVGSEELGAALRAALGVGTSGFVSLAAQSNIDFEFSGTATVLPEPSSNGLACAAVLTLALLARARGRGRPASDAGPRTG